MSVRPYISDEIHRAVLKYARRKVITYTEAYTELIKRLLDEDGNPINEIIDSELKSLEQSKQKLSMYIDNTQCKWCKLKAQIIYNALNELIQLHKKGEEFVNCLNNSDNLNSLEN